MKILVTGGAGFIGLEIVKQLSIEKSNQVVILDDLSKQGEDDELLEVISQSNVSFHKLDMSNPDCFSMIDSDFDQIYHLAAIVGVSNVMNNPLLTLNVNIRSTLNLLDFVTQMKKKPSILFTSSCENYAGSIELDVASIPTPEHVPLCITDVFNPRWTYASSKIIGEQAFLYYAEKYNLRSRIIRYHNVYGPRMGTHHVIPEFIQRVLNKENPFNMYGGDQYRTFCYVSDAAKMTINVMNDSKNSLYNIGSSDDEILIRDIAELLFSISDHHPDIEENGAPNGSVTHRKPDMTKMNDEGLYVYRTNFEEGLKKTFDWYQKHKV